MLVHAGRRSPGAWLLAVACASCLAATGADATVYTEVDCGVNAPVTVIVGSDVHDLENRAQQSIVSTTKLGCAAGGRVGDFVLAPPQGSSGSIAFEVMTRPDGQSPDSCGKDPTGCIIAKRWLGFTPHEMLSVRVDLRSSCLNIACGTGQTCVQGLCKDAKCKGDCGESALTPPLEGSATSSGTVDAMPFNATDAIFNSPVATSSLGNLVVVLGSEQPPVQGTGTLLLVGSNPSACASVSAPSGSQFLAMLAEVDASGVATPPSSPGSFTIVDQAPIQVTGKIAVVLSLTCGLKYSSFGSSGSVDVTDLTGTDVAGTFDITFADAYPTPSHTTGTFAAVACSATFPQGC